MIKLRSTPQSVTPRVVNRIALVAIILIFASSNYLHAEDNASPQPLERVKAVKMPKSLFERVLELNQVQEPELDPAAMRKAFGVLMDRARPEVEKAQTPKDKIAALNKALLDERNVEYLSNLYWRDATLAASLLRKQGNCLSTSTLYLLAGEALKLPIHMVMVPHHAYARWEEGATRINIETTAKGCEIADTYYFRQECQSSPRKSKRITSVNR